MNSKYQSLLSSLPNHGGTMLVNGRETIFSYLELSRPTGKYVARFIIRITNILMRKHYFRFLGNSCTPGLILSDITPEGGIKQFDTSQNTCGVIIANVLGHQVIKDAVVIPAEPFMVIHLSKDWKSFEDYKNALSSKYRVRTNRVFVLSEGIVMKNLNELGLDNWIEPCADLLFETLKHKTITIGKDLRLLLDRFKQNLGSDFRMNGYFLNGKLIGFISYILDEDQIHAMHLGYDVTLGTPIHLYQRIMYDLIANGIEKGVTTINLGRTATEIKSTFGAVPIDNSFVFFSKTRLLKWSIQLYAQKFHQSPDFIIRHPFKTEKKKA